MIRSAHLVVIASIFLLCCLTDSTGSSSSGDGESKLMCKVAERRALLEIKDGLYEVYEENVLQSWGEEEAKRECCEWIGIRCDNESGHVIRLDLSPSTFDGGEHYHPLGGNISSSLAHLHYLNYLDLSGIDFYGNSIPSFIGNLSKLRYLDLSSTSLSGRVPPQLGNLSSLEFLNLSTYNYYGYIRIKNLEWASRLSSLRVLDLGYTNMSSAYDWAHVVGNLPYLTELRLCYCSLPNVVPSSLLLVNSSKLLSVLDLSQNSLSGSIFQWLFNYSNVPSAFESMDSLEYLDLSTNNLEGSIPESFGNMSNLEYLNLEKNNLEGEIPKSIWEICSLRNFKAKRNNLSGQIHFAQSSSRCADFSLEYLDLSGNQITGSLPNFTLYPSLIELGFHSNRFNGNVSETIGQLSKLEVLDISENSLSGAMSEAHFSKLSSLYHLDLSHNPSLALNISPHWIPLFQLETIYLRSCRLGPRFPKWLQTQRHFLELDISSSRLSDPVPDWFWNASTDFWHMNLSNNQISGTIQDQHFRAEDFLVIDLSSNQIEGSIPLFLLQVTTASHLSHNKFSSLSSICNATDRSVLILLDISHNQLAGELPDCWSHFDALQILILSNNNFSGIIPDSLGSLPLIHLLDLGYNSFTGNLPLSLSKSSLAVLDVGENRLVGPVPQWLGVLQDLIILNLRSNRFNGSLPSSLCRLAYVQVLDLSSNNIYGKIPNCVGNLTAMKKNGSLHGNRIFFEFGNTSTAITLFYPGSKPVYAAQSTIMWKGKLSRYKNTLRLVKIISLSNNKLVGKIPREIMHLDGLIALDLSRNGLAGQIPAEIGHLKSLEVLDLSRNHLSGIIPQSMSELNFIDALDVSDNNLSGKIPTSTQLQSFDPASYEGNRELCGDPLPNRCLGEEETSSIGSNDSRDQDGEEQDSFIAQGFYVSLGLGYVVGFWGICGSLLFIKSR